MSKTQYYLVVGLLFSILSRVSSNFKWLTALLGLLGVAYFVVVEVAAMVDAFQQRNKPPYRSAFELYFKTPEERARATELVQDALTQARREADPTNGLTPEQLEDAGLDETGTATTTFAVKNSRKKQVPYAESAKKIVQLDKAGKTAQEIADELGYADTSVIFRTLRKEGRGRRGRK